MARVATETAAREIGANVVRVRVSGEEAERTYLAYNVATAGTVRIEAEDASAEAEADLAQVADEEAERKRVVEEVATPAALD